MKRKPIVIAIILTALVTIGFGLLLLITPRNRQGMLRDTETATVVPPTQDYRTVAFEKTAIAVFTQNPTLALSSTPFFAEIIYNDALRYYTETPVPGVFPEAKCLPPIIDFFHLRPLNEAIRLSVGEVGIDAPVQVATLGFWGIDETCETFQPVNTVIRVWVKQTVREPSSFGDYCAAIISAIAQHIDNADRISPVAANIYLDLYFNPENVDALSQGWTLRVSTSWDVALEAYGRGMRGKALIQALGGINRD